MVVKHNHQPVERTKFLGAKQTRYPFKNWSSLMLFNCAHPSCRSLTPEYINSAPGLDLHGFAWVTQDDIREVDGLWNVLVTGPSKRDLVHPELPLPGGETHLLHYTRGGPWHGVRETMSHLWDHELGSLLAEGNPKAILTQTTRGGDANTSVTFRAG